MLFEQIITDNTLLQPYEYINTEIAEDGHRLVLHLASRKDTATGLKPPRGLPMDTGMKTISSHGSSSSPSLQSELNPIEKREEPKNLTDGNISGSVACGSYN